MANTASNTKVITGECRLSYVHVFEPYSRNPKQDAKYSVMLLIPKSDKKTYKKLMEAQAAAIENGKDRAFNGKPPKNPKSIIKDGDGEHPETGDPYAENNPEREGHWFMTVSAATKPGVVDQQVNEILDSSEIYSGCYARASINAFAYNQEGNRGVSFGLNHIQKLRDGDFLGGRSRAEDDFDAVDDDDDDDDVI